ncbi:DUF1648 domain-containing protein [Oceanobacillus halophilus]|uniref:DUF1648 domain-containing protein n=1 Tax=Oceanobacillus halophilus TaxID=930130 RepID=A0A494ZZ90_9BACI|nr:DUF5808 domain-containing protein [Oceanobacillus halophilus]RKQ31396.1 DUF1648 domain-containing protein [Oceanobacillus halophilus]
MDQLMFILFLIIFLPVFLISIFIPYWTRKTESFGVSIPEEIYHTPKLKNMRRRFATGTGIVSILTSIIFFILSGLLGTTEQSLSILFSILLIVFLIASFLIYLKFHSEMKAMKKKENWAKEKSQQVFINTNFREQKLTYSNFWFVIPIVIAIIMIFIAFQAYQQIPNRIPIKFNFNGEITNWAEKSYRSVLLHPIMMIYLTFLFFFINVTISKAKQQIDPNNPESSIKKNIMFRKRWSAYTIASSYALTILFSINHLSLIYPIEPYVLSITSMIITGIIVIGAVILSITTGQGGSRIKDYQIGNGSVINRDDDKYWKLGIFYFNREDPALFLEKRFGVGWTINLARPLAWIIFTAIIGIAFALPFFLGS